MHRDILRDEDLKKEVEIVQKQEIKATHI